MPRIARPSLMWSRVVTSLAVRPGLRKVFAPTISPSRIRLVRAAQAASVVQPSKMGWRQGPWMASRWSHVQSESQPADSASSAASRKRGQSLACDQSWAPNRVLDAHGSSITGPP